MVEKTVPPPVSRADYEARASCVTSAAFEIQLVAKMLQQFIAEADECGEIYPVTRGILLRVHDLTNAIHYALQDDSLSPNELQIARTVLFGKEAAHA